MANKEQLVSFVAITIVTIVLMSLLAYATVFGIEGDNNISFLEAEGIALNERVGDWFGYLFWIIGATSLFAAALGIVDYTCRLVADVLKVSYLRDNETWSESRIYFLLVWLLVVERDHPADHPVPAADPADHLRLHRRVHDVHLLGPADPDQQAVAAARGPDHPVPNGHHGLVGAAVRDRLGDRHQRPVGQHQGAVRPLAAGAAVYRFLLTVAIALVVWALLAGLAALLGFL